MARFSAHALMQGVVGASFSEQTAQMSTAEELFFHGGSGGAPGTPCEQFPTCPMASRRQATRGQRLGLRGRRNPAAPLAPH
eukprot:7733802-Pyramimonas_sp.AAC.1